MLDDYVGGEFEEHAEDRLTSHLGECEECARAYQLVKREQEIYSRFLLEVEATPLLWANLRKGIEAEDIRQKRKSLSWLVEWSQSVFPVPGRVPVFAAMALIVAAAVLVWMQINSRQQKPGLVPDNAQLAENRKVTLPAEPPRQTDTPSALVSRREDSSLTGSRQQVSTRRYGPKDRGRELRVARTGSEDFRAWLRKVTTTGDSSEQFVPASSLVSGAWDSEAGRHVQKAEVLLRSFRNSLGVKGAGLDVSYEKRQSRELIARNILLRREAQSTGDLATEELLSRLEPILIDIANLPKKTSSQDVRQIKEQMRREGIVSALYFRQTSPAVF